MPDLFISLGFDRVTGCLQKPYKKQLRLTIFLHSHVLCQKKKTKDIKKISENVFI